MKIYEMESQDLAQCPFDASHRMSHKRLPWHMLKCPSRCQLFHCQYNHSHFFLSEIDKDSHEMECMLVKAMEGGAKITDGEWDLPASSEPWS